MAIKSIAAVGSTPAAELISLSQPGSHTVVTIDDTATLGSSAFGKLHKVAETSATFDITLPSVTGNAGKRIGFLGDNTTNLTKAIRVLPASGTIQNQSWLMIVAERYVVVECDGTNWKIVAENSFQLEANLEIEISNAMTNAVIKEWLAYAPRNLNTYLLTFDFNNGTGTPKTYTISATWEIKGFYNGELKLNGDMTISVLSTSQGVYLDAGSNEGHVLTIRENRAIIHIYGFKIRVKGDSNPNACVYIANNGYLTIYYCYLLSTSNTKGSGLQIYCGVGTSAWYNYVDNFYIAIEAAVLSTFVSGGTTSIGTNSQYGLSARNNSTIGKFGTQPAASIAAEFTHTGSVIR